MNLREIIIERILFACTEEELARDFHVSEAELHDLSDTDLIDLYDDVIMELVDGV